jgi:hypothetical protein
LKDTLILPLRHCLIQPIICVIEGLSDTFVEYMKPWKGFVKGEKGFIDNQVILNS